MAQRAVSSMVGRPETKERLFRTIQASNNGGSISPNGTIEDIEELEWRGLNTYWDKKNKSNNEISKQVSQRNNRENIKKNSRVEQIAAAFRGSYQANAKELKGLLNENGSINNDELIRITTKILSGEARIRSPFFGYKTKASPSSRRIIEATIIGQAVRQ
jgi:hypothetical protein